MVRGFLAFRCVFAMLIYLHLADIIKKMYPALSNFMSNLKRQAATRKLSSLAGVGKEKVVVEEAAPITKVVPPTISRKRGRPPKVQTVSEVG